MNDTADSAEKTLVRFYVFDRGGRSARLHLACRLCEKAQEAGRKTIVLCEDDAMRAELDRLLWSFRAESFVTHALPGSELAAEAAVLLLVPPERAQRAEVMINLSLENHCDTPRGCVRVFEIVSHEADVREATRKRFALYRARGWEPQTHVLGK